MTALLRPDRDVPIRLSDEVATALGEGRPVVALESTVLAHAFDPATALDVARESERRVRAAGSVPATIGVIDHHIAVGMGSADLERFAENGSAVRKLAARDLAPCLVHGDDGALTVGATLTVCAPTGIRVTSTGGLGGVHRGAGESFDVSGDLTKLTRSPTVVVCSGIKSILDVPATMEYLETLAVPVIGWQTDHLPLYYQAVGGPALSVRVDTAAEVAAIARIQRDLHRTTAIVLTRAPSVQVDVESLIEAGVRSARELGVVRPSVTPFLLDYLDTHSRGRTVEPHKTLLVENAHTAAHIAAEMSTTHKR